MTPDHEMCIRISTRLQAGGARARRGDDPESARCWDPQFCQALTALPDSIGNLVALQQLNLQWCKALTALPTP